MARNFVQGNTEWFRVTSTPVTGYPLTMACWFRDTNASASNDRTMMQIADYSLADQWFRLHKVDATRNVEAAAFDGTTLRTAGGTTTYSQNVWHHACGVYNSGVNEMWVYTDGGDEQQATGNMPSPTGIDEIGIGIENKSIGGTDPWDGDLAECGIWNVILTTAEIAALGAGYSPLFVRPQNLLFYAPLRMASGDELDLMGGRTLSDQNTVTAADHPPGIIYPKRADVWLPPAASGPTITDVDTDEAWTDGDTGLVITGTGFV